MTSACIRDRNFETQGGDFKILCIRGMKLCEIRTEPRFLVIDGSRSYNKMRQGQKKVVNSITTMEQYLSKHILREYDNLLM